MVTPNRPRPLLILGRAPNAADLALRRILRAKEADQPLVVVDYQGSLAGVLTPRNKGNLHKGPVLWCDLANRRRPTALFRFKQTAGMRPALRAFLLSCVQLLALPVSVPTIDAVVELAYRLAEQGTIGLAVLLRGLQRPELSQPLRRAECSADEIARLVELLDWILRFPAVWALSEGNNQVDLSRAMGFGGTVWIEIPGLHFERLEHQVVSWMVDATLMDALIAGPHDHGKNKVKQSTPMVLYGFPQSNPLPMACKELAAKQVGVFTFGENHPFPAAARPWVDFGADCWIAGEVGALPTATSTNLLDDAERGRLKQLASGQVWVRSGADHKAVTMLVRPPEDNRTLPHGLRRMASTRLRLTPVKQFSSALAREEILAPQNADLYATLCKKETLYAGWFRVKAHNRKSHGHDRVTVEQFGANLDAELDRLAGELTAGRYRSRPLRTVRIPKPDGDWRVLRIACVRDRVVQAACLQLIEPLFDARFSPVSFAYRPGLGAHHAVALARSAIRAGKHYVVTANIRKCFDSIDHDILLRLVGDVIGDRDLIQLIRNWLTGDVIDFMDIIPSELGVPQGEAISPLLANIYLDPMDKEFEKAGATFVRYADDYLVLCDSEADAHAKLRLMSDFLQGMLRLALKPAKTQYGHISGGVTFLGFQIEMADVRMPADKVDRVVEAVASRLDVLGDANSAAAEKWHAAVHMNALIRGIRNYFLIDDAPGVRAQLAAMDVKVDELAGQRFAKEAGLDLVWSSRERFLPADGSAMNDAEVVGAAATVAGGYAQPEAAGQAYASALGPAPPAAETNGLATTTDADRQRAASSLPGQAVDADVLIVDGRLHVMTSGCYVTVSADELVVRKRKNEIFRTPLVDLTMLYLEGKGIALSADLTMLLCERDIPVVFTPLVGRPAAVAQSVQSIRSNVRQQQVLRRNDPEIVKSGLRMLAAKVANQASVLKYFARYRKRTGDAAFEELTCCAGQLREIAATLDGLDPAAAGVRAMGMGHEGRAAAKYWTSFANLIPDELTFPGRHTRHATDAVNSAINYVYSVLYGEVWRAVIRAGLDPYFGIMHGTERDQGSLVFDLIEEYRAPFGDRLVIGMLGRGFALELDKDGLLRAACRRKLVQAFHRLWNRAVRCRGKMFRPSELLNIQVTSLKNAYLGGEEYRPFRFQW